MKHAQYKYLIIINHDDDDDNDDDDGAYLLLSGISRQLRPRYRGNQHVANFDQSKVHQNCRPKLE
jgi:hypothetical protein